MQNIALFSIEQCEQPDMNEDMLPGLEFAQF